MASTIRCFNLFLGYKGNKYKGYKWILALLKFKGLVKELVKNKSKNKKIREKGVEWDYPRSAVNKLNI